jgi:hypothetical protein
MSYSPLSQWNCLAPQRKTPPSRTNSRSIDRRADMNEGVRNYSNPSYRRNHHRVRTARGKASLHTCFHACGSDARDWAQLHGSDGTDPQKHFVPLCRPCHISYDGHQTNGGNSSEARAARRRGKKASIETRERLRQSHLGNSPSPEHREKLSKATKGKPWSDARRAAFERKRNAR